MEGGCRSTDSSCAVIIDGRLGQIGHRAHWKVGSHVGGQGRATVELDWEINANIQSGPTGDAKLSSAAGDEAAAAAIEVA